MTSQTDPISDMSAAHADSVERVIASPAWLLGVATFSVALGLAAHFSGELAGHVIGYVLDSLVPFTLVAWYRRRSLERLIVAGLPPSREANTFAWLILIAGFACALLHAWSIARHLA